MRRKLISLGDESGIALVMALGITLVLTIVLTTVITFTAAGARDSHRVNAGQKATALAEAGLNNALAVLNQNYPGIGTYPGNSALLPARTTTYPTGSVTWSGTLESAPVTAIGWRHEWRVTAVGSVANPTGPGASPVARRLTAVVPIVIPESVSADPSTSSLNWVYAFYDVEFGESVRVASPVYAGRNLTLTSTSTISEVIPASVTDPARPNKVVVGNDFWQKNPQNQTGRTLSPPGNLASVYVAGRCARGGSPSWHTPCLWGAVDKIWADLVGTTPPTDPINPDPKITCCAPALGSLSTAPAETPTSIMGFWYNNAYLGPNALCDPAQSSGPVPRFDTASGTPDGTINQSATAGGAPFDLTGSTYTCKRGEGELSYNAGTKTLTIKGPIYIDGSVESTADGVTYVGKGALILTGTFLMLNNTSLCVALAGNNKDCDVTTDWDPDVAGMFVFAAGTFDTDLSSQNTSIYPDTGIEIKKGEFQGGLFASRNVDASVTGTVVQGPLISAYANVAAGQSGELSFPAISFPTSGSSGFVGPLPLPKLLPPRQFGGG